MRQKVVNFVIQDAYFPLRTQKRGEIRGKTTPSEAIDAISGILNHSDRNKFWRKHHG
ncbi:hypothetical protein [Nitrosospira briensis]|uniref:hypothetical protein n=1 Tax=Nitrosospira briensis TaxID=35799 RepID=UPI0008ED3C08|nr:hypothetical protein [Nitrosospira briensis]SFO27492.1 hypothetical protein SAMN05216332_109107 [Nitrosospira briensis]